MDNSNDPNSLNSPNPNPAPAFGAPSSSPPPNLDTQPIVSNLTPLSPATPTPTWPPPSSNSQPEPDLSSTWAPATNPQPQATPTIPDSQIPSSNLDTSFNPFNTTAPAPSPVPPQTPSAWPSMPSAVPPTPIPSTFTPQPDPSTSPTAAPSLSPLDNPWSTPVQSQPLDASPSPQPTWMPNPTDNSPTTNQISANPFSSSVQQQTAPLPAGLGAAPTQPEPAAPPQEASLAPTDLSHLISNNYQETGTPSTSTGPETSVVPSQPSNPTPEAEVPTIPTQNHQGIPKWLIGVGVILLIVVIGASAYFILGVGQSAKTTNSIPVEVSKTQVQTPPPIATPVARPSSPTAATGSANFGQLQGSGTQQATSAADLLRQRQQSR